MSTSPAGAKQFVAASEELVVPDAFDPKKKLRATMLVSDLALRFDPAYAPISLKFSQDLPALTDAFGKAWFKLLHRDLGVSTIQTTHHLKAWTSFILRILLTLDSTANFSLFGARRP